MEYNPQTMRFSQTILLLASLCLFTLSGTNAQTEDDPPTELDKWFIDNFYPGFPGFGNSKGYSKADLQTFRSIFTTITESSAKGDWQGEFEDENVGIGYEKFHYISGVGFVSYYVYTCYPEFRGLSFGNAVETDDHILLMPDGPTSLHGKPVALKQKRYVKVIWDDRQYLVAESSLLAFAEKAAGIDVDLPADENENPTVGREGIWYDYWVRGDLENEPKGLPKFPQRYKHFLREPVNTSILSIAPRRLMEEYGTGNTIHSSGVAVYKVVLAHGTNRGIRPGMRLYSSDDEIYIETVSATRSYGVVVRSIDENKKDRCYDDSGETSCPRMRPHSKVKTQTGALRL